MSIFSYKKTGGFMDQIRCDEPSYLIWKWHPSGVKQGEGNRENAIRWGSSLRVKDGEVAVFVYHQKDGRFQDFIEGPFDKRIETSNFPVLASLVGLAYEGGTPFQAEIYFINLARIVQVRFAVPFFDVYDPRFDDFGVPVAVRGTISFQIKDYREFIKLHRLIDFNLDDFQKQIRDVSCRYVKDAVSNAPAANNIPVVQLESRISQINDSVEYNLSQRLQENFGVLVSGVDIGTIEIDKTSYGYRQLMSVTKDVTQETIQAQKQASIKNIHDKQRVEAHDYEETLRVRREERQYAVHKQSQSANMGVFQVEKQAEVGVFVCSGNEIGFAIVIYKDIAIARFCAKRTTCPYASVRTCHVIAFKNSCFACAVVSCFPMTPNHKFLCLCIIHEFWTLNHARFAQLWVCFMVLNDFSFEVPMHEILCGIEVYVGIP